MKLLSAIFSLSLIAGQAVAGISIGVLAPQGAEQAQNRWTPFFETLSQELGQEISLFPVTATEGPEFFGQGHLDFLLGNPVQAAVVIDTMAGIPVASMVKKSGSEFAGVIIVAPDSPIQTITELSGARIATLGDWAAGGYLFQSDYLIQNGLQKPAQLGQRVRADNQTDMVALVMSGAVDAAFIRTGVIEGLIAKGMISEGQVRVLDNKASAGEMARTTDWFPEWLMIAQNAVDPQMIDALRTALSDMSPDNPAVQNAQIVGFIEPIENGPVIAAMQRVGVAPYE